MSGSLPKSGRPANPATLDQRSNNPTPEGDLDTQSVGSAANRKATLEVFRGIFRGLPSEEDLIEDFTCALQRDILLQGRLYITNNYFCFHSNIVGWETVLTIKFSDITSIEKVRTAIVFPNAIQVTTAHQKFTFSSFISRDQAFARLTDLWNAKRTPSSGAPSTSAILGGEFEDPPTTISTGSTTGSLIPAATEKVTVTKLSPSSVMSASPAVLQPTEAKGLSDTNMLDPSASPQVKGRASVTKSDIDSVAAKDTGSAGEVTGPPVDCGCGDDHLEREIFNEVYSCDVPTMFALLYGVGSDFGKDFLVKQCGYKNLTDPEWGEVEGKAERLVTYTKPLKRNAVGPSAADVHERQTVVKDDGAKCKVVVLECRTPFLPYGDCFYSQCRVCISHEAPGKCRLRCTASVIWVKSVMGWMKSYITKNTYEGIESQNLDSAKALHRFLYKEGKGEAELPPPPVAAPQKEEVEEKSTFQQIVGQYFIIVLLVVVIVSLLLLAANVMLLARISSLESALQTWTNHYQASSNIDSLLANGPLPPSDVEWLNLLRTQQRQHAVERQAWQLGIKKAQASLRHSLRSLEDLSASSHETSQTPGKAEPKPEKGTCTPGGECPDQNEKYV